VQLAKTHQNSGQSSCVDIHVETPILLYIVLYCYIFCFVCAAAAVWISKLACQLAGCIEKEAINSAVSGSCRVASSIPAFRHHGAAARGGEASQRTFGTKVRCSAVPQAEVGLGGTSRGQKEVTVNGRCSACNVIWCNVVECMMQCCVFIKVRLKLWGNT
jgi:hypothetical protein